jgi:DNA-binding NarL/FixJ family response regulator
LAPKSDQNFKSAVLREITLASTLAFVLKSSRWNAVCEAIREARRGGTPLSPEVKPILLQLVRSAGGEHRVKRLTHREQQILELLGKKSRNKEIAVRINLSVSTVRTHLRAIYSKLNIRSRSEAVEKLGQPGKKRSDIPVDLFRQEPFVHLREGKDRGQPQGISESSIGGRV